MTYDCINLPCKTPGCDGSTVAAVLGESRGPITRLLPEDLPNWWEVECLVCGNIHSYTPDDLVPGLVAAHPPPGWKPLSGFGRRTADREICIEIGR
jgi:hypothetical protein